MGNNRGCHADILLDLCHATFRHTHLYLCVYLIHNSENMTCKWLKGDWNSQLLTIYESINVKRSRTMGSRHVVWTIKESVLEFILADCLWVSPLIFPIRQLSYFTYLYLPFRDFFSTNLFLIRELLYISPYLFLKDLLLYFIFSWFFPGPDRRMTNLIMFLLFQLYYLSRSGNNVL